MEKIYTLDLTETDLRFIQSLTISMVNDATRIIRSPEFDNYGPVESADIHRDIREGCQLLGKLPHMEVRYDD